jgi:Ca-activated chloride channel homolog
MRLAFAVLLAMSTVALADRPAPKRQPIAVVVLVETSRMMGGRLDEVKEMVDAIVATLDPDDAMAVIAFDTDARSVIRLQRAANKLRIHADVKRLTAAGQTSYLPALTEAAKQLDGVTWRKHVILVSGGLSPPDGLADKATAMRAAGITITTIGMLGAERADLSKISDAGEGRLYMVEDLAALPKIGIKEVREVIATPVRRRQ